MSRLGRIHNSRMWVKPSPAETDLDDYVTIETNHGRLILVDIVTMVMYPTESEPQTESTEYKPVVADTLPVWNSE